MHLNDSHHKAYVHWSEDNHETVVVLTCDPNITPRSTSAVWISRDYAQSFENYTQYFNLSNGDLAQINLFYSSPVDKTKVTIIKRCYYYSACFKHNIFHVPNGIKIKHKDTALFDINRCYNEKIGD
jgi:hypothetical protein